MTSVEKIAELHEKEKEALKKYNETNDKRYLQQIKSCINERLELLDLRASAYSVGLLNEKER